MKPGKLYIFCLLLITLLVKGQKDAKNIYYGNQLYHEGHDIQSTELYRNALKENPTNGKAHFNLGNSLYKNALQIKASKSDFHQAGKIVKPDSLAALVFDEAAQSFAQAANTISNRDTLHRTWHNIGNCYLQKKDYQQAVDAYKKSLKLDPKDEETRYNLAYALKHLDKKGGGGGGGSQNKKEEDKNDKNKNASPKNDMSKDQAEQLLKALMQDEKKLHDKKKQKQEDANNKNVEKDW